MQEVTLRYQCLRYQNASSKCFSFRLANNFAFQLKNIALQVHAQRKIEIRVDLISMGNPYMKSVDPCILQMYE